MIAESSNTVEAAVSFVKEIVDHAR
jgi:hypothetical protein